MYRNHLLLELFGQIFFSVLDLVLQHNCVRLTFWGAREQECLHSFSLLECGSTEMLLGRNAIQLEIVSLHVVQSLHCQAQWNTLMKDYIGDGHSVAGNREKRRLVRIPLASTYMPNLHALYTYIKKHHCPQPIDNIIPAFSGIGTGVHPCLPGLNTLPMSPPVGCLKC